MPQPGGSVRGPKQSRGRWPPRRDWRSLLPDLEQMVPWPRGEGRGRRTQAQVLESVLGYIQYLQRTLSILQGGAGCSGGGGTTEVGLSAEATEGQQLVPYEEEEEELGEGCSPWLGPTGPYWEAVGWEGAVPLSPPTQQEGLLGLSPSLLASPPPPGPPDEVIRALFADIYLSPQAPAVAPHEAAADGSAVPPMVAVGMGGTPQGPRGRGQGAPPRQKKKCVNGFIMFCCMNRKPYMSTHPGLPSTVVTRELAQLWRSLSPKERRPYCLRARRFNRLHDRMMRPERDGDGDKDDDGDTYTPVPLQLLLATRAGTPGGGPLPP